VSASNVSYNFAGKTILVTGASSGIGKSCAERLAGSGARVLAVGRQAKTLAAVNGIREPDRLVADLTDEVQVKALAKSIKAGGIAMDGCVFAAGMHSFRPLMVEDFGNLAKPWIVNTQSTLGLIAALVKARLLVKRASLVLFSSAAARTGSPGALAYAASKGALEAASATLALELGSTGMRVNTVAPGVVKTPMSDAFIEKLTPEQRARVESHHPMGFGSPEDVSGPVAFLLSEDARWINGAVLPVDGGYSIA
jgi:NAD(P)-dependent dehydrogenase (short-subunit alcohol dehydrogenase family)